MNVRFVVRFAAAMMALAMLAVPAQAMAGKGKGKSKKPFGLDPIPALTPT